MIQTFKDEKNLLCNSIYLALKLITISLSLIQNWADKPTTRREIKLFQEVTAKRQSVPADICFILQLVLLYFTIQMLYFTSHGGAIGNYW